MPRPWCAVLGGGCRQWQRGGEGWQCHARGAQCSGGGAGSGRGVGRAGSATPVVRSAGRELQAVAEGWGGLAVPRPWCAVLGGGCRQWQRGGEGWQCNAHRAQCWEGAAGSGRGVGRAGSATPVVRSARGGGAGSGRGVGRAGSATPIGRSAGRELQTVAEGWGGLAVHARAVECWGGGAAVRERGVGRGGGELQ